jgi:SAM-dependent MidA family methyltransferase
LLQTDNSASCVPPGIIFFAGISKAGNMTLADIIVNKIRNEGPISFYEFMEMALYHPLKGYYTSGEGKIGIRGDYYTSPALSSLFGQMLGRQLEEMWRLLGKRSFTIVEYGAGTGLLCKHILDYLKNNKAFYNKLVYCIVEKSGAMRKKQEEILCDKVTWLNSISDIPPITGCIVSNELVDNFSVHQVMMKDELMEIFVDYDNGFIERLFPAGNELTNYLYELQVHLPNGFRTEINLEAVRWISEIAQAVERGFVLTIDYGYPSSDLYNINHSSGTLMCYYKHKTNTCPYQNIGDQDITAHVNFSALSHWGMQNGLKYGGFTDQARFLQGLGLTGYIIEMEKAGYIQQQSIKEYATLIRTLLMDMGSKLKVLLQHKGVKHAQLSGIQFPQLFM